MHHFKWWVMFECIIRQRQTMQWHKTDCFLGTTMTVTKSKTQTESTFECYSSLPVTHHTTTSSHYIQEVSPIVSLRMSKMQNIFSSLHLTVALHIYNLFFLLWSSEIGKVGLKLKKVKNPCPSVHWAETLQMVFGGRKKSIIFCWACILAAKTNCTLQSPNSHIHVCKRLSKTTSSAADDGADPLKKVAMQIS